MLAVIAIHVVLTAVTAVLTPRLGPRTFLLAALGPLSGVALLIASAPTVLAGGAWTQSYQWVPGIDLAISLRLDGLSWLMLVLVSGIGTVIFTFTAWYAHRDESLTRFVATLTAFAGAMVGLVLADDVLLLYVFWELTSITSFLLVGLNTTDAASRRAALQALLITVLGGLAMLVGLLIIAYAGGTTQLSALLANPPTPTPVVSAGLVLIVVGAITKSAQAPFHIWLPGAMAAPTPVSAYLHAAAMVKAGIYLLARFAPAYAEQVAWWRPALVGFGITTMLIGGWRALRQHDLKRLLAFSTVSQLGFLTIVAGWGSDVSLAALSLLLLAHGFAKAALFCSLGALDHQAGTRDLRRLSGMGKRMPVLAAAAWVAALSMAGVPLLLGFIAKEEVLGLLVAAITEGEVVLPAIALIGILLGSTLTMAYALRFGWGAFATKKLSADDPDHAPDLVPAGEVSAPSWGMTVPVTLLSVVTVTIGVLPQLVNDPVSVVSGHEVHLALWHGVNVPLVLSAGVLALGIGCFYFRSTLLRTQDRVSPLTDAVDGDLLYDRTLRGVDRFSRFVTGMTQVGSLPSYLGTILVVAVTLPTVALLIGTTEWTAPPWVDQVAQVPVVLVTIGAALLACVSRVRLTAVLMLGAVGYGVAGLFALQGAPDLALTQLLVETLSLVAFLFVLRLLPYRFPTQVRRASTFARAGLALAVGVFAATLALLATNPNRNEEVGPSVATGMLADSYPEGHGRNVVNVILVDFRGLDTLGEATVVLVAALGIATLVLTARTVATPTIEVQSSMLLRAAIRSIFHPILATALYLLFAGHNNPGGGFIAGLVAGSAFVLRYLSADGSSASAPFNPRYLLGLGLLLASGTAVAPLFGGAELLTSGYHSLALPLLGSVSLTSVLIFDTGVFCVVVGITLTILDTLGSRQATSLGVVNEEVKL